MKLCKFSIYFTVTGLSPDKLREGKWKIYQEPTDFVNAIVCPIYSFLPMNEWSKLRNVVVVLKVIMCSLKEVFVKKFLEHQN
jgi:hypothetical protein